MQNLFIAKQQVDRPFEQTEEVEQLHNEFAAIDAELDLGKQEVPIVLENEDDTPVQPVALHEAEDEYELIAV